MFFAMYLPRWVVVLLFATSIGSLSTVMYLLIARGPSTLAKAVPQATVVVTDSPAGEMKQTAVEPSPAADDAMMASAKWSTREEKSLNFKVDYPAAWAVTFENNVLLISDPQSLTKSVTVTRAEKPGKSAATDTVVKTRKEVLDKDTAVDNIKDEKVRIDDAYDGILLHYARGDVATQELVFVTRSYVYTVVMVPDDTEMAPVFGEIVKSIDIL